MKAPKHTPGPWCLVGVDELGPLSIMTTAEAPTRAEYISDTGYSFFDAGDATEWETLVADHRLMAAAPDLLAACEFVRRQLPPSQEWTRRSRDMADTLDRAIARAGAA